MRDAGKSGRENQHGRVEAYDKRGKHIAEFDRKRASN